MDEQNVLASDDVCDSHCLNSERSKFSVQNSATREESSCRLLSADHTQFLSADRKQRSADRVLLSVPGSQASGIETSANFSAENQKFAGDSDGLEHVGASSSGRKRIDGRVINVDVCSSPCQPLPSVADSAVPQEVNDSAKAHAQVIGETPGNSEIRKAAVLLSNQQAISYASAAARTLGDAIPCSTDVAMDAALTGIPMHLDGAQQAGATDLVKSVTKEGCGGEASLEMLSVAVESVENMHRESRGASGGAGEAVDRTGAGKHVLVHEGEHDAVKAGHNVVSAKCGIIESSAKKSLANSEVNGSFILNNKVLGKDLQNKDDFLSLLCELAAVQQREQDFSGKCSDQGMTCIESFTGNQLGGELKTLSFVDLLRKQMAQAGTLTESTVDAFYEQFMRQNQAILGTTVIETFNISLPPAGISSSDGDGTAVEVEQVFIGHSDREGDAMSNEEIIDDCKGRNGEAQDEVGGCSSQGDEKKVEIRGEAKKFRVGDLVWAKVKSHPWWPGQIFNAADASRAAKKIQRPGKTLVAFFGDGTFGWLQQSQLIAFRPHFEEKAKQTTMKSFCKAVAEALNEVSRRTELGLRCAHFSDAIYSTDVFPDLNAGMRKGVRIKRHQDIRMSREKLEPNKILEFIHSAACFPCYPLSSGLEYSVLCGHVYGFRNFMLSPKKPKNKIATQNVLKGQKKLTSAESFSLKRRMGMDPIGDSSSVALGKEAKRLHLSKNKMSEEQYARSRVQSPKLSNIENLIFTESDERMEVESENKSPEPVKGSTWLAKGKRLQASPDGKEGKRSKGWHSLGPLGDLAGSGGADNLTGTDDDSKTLLDITGYRSLKRKKKGGTSRSITDVVAMKVEQQPLEARETQFSEESLSKVEVIGEEGGNFPDISISSLSTVVPDQNPSILTTTKECEMAKECDKVKDELLDLVVDDAEEIKGNRELLDSKVIDADKMEGDSGVVQDLKMGDGQEETKDDEGELHALRDTPAEDDKVEKEETPDIQVGDARESEKDEEKLLDVKESTALVQDGNNLDNTSEIQTEGLHSHSQEEGKEKGELLGMRVVDAEGSEKDKRKSEKLLECALGDAKKEYNNILKRNKQQSKHLHSHSLKHEKGEEELQGLKLDVAEEFEKEKGKILDLKYAESPLQDFSDGENVVKKNKKPKKRLHTQQEELLSLLVKRKKKQETVKEEKEPSLSSENEQLGSKKSDKSSKLGASMKKGVDLLKGKPKGLKLASMSSAKKAVSAANIDFEVQKHLKSPKSNQSSAFKNVADENRYSSLAKLLKNLQAVARDPANSATMKSSLHGVMSTFLNFRSMVFLKSSGYVASGLGKSVPSCGNGHLSGEKKVDDKGGAGKKNTPLERRKSFATDSSEERKSVVKAELPSESVGPGSQRLVGQAAMKRPSPPPTSIALASQKSDVSKWLTDTEAASSEMPSCSKILTGGSQKLGVQELAVAARKKKSEVLKECAAKVQVKNQVLKGVNSFNERADKEKFTDARHHVRSVKHHISRGEILERSPMYNSAGVKVAQTSLGLFMQFPEDFALPSEAQLKELFNPFGILEAAGIRVYKNASTAQVVFKHSTDAEAAWQHARKNRMFGHANVSYRLRHFSLSTKSNSKVYEVAPGKNGVPAKAVAVRSQLEESHGRPHDGRTSLPSGAEQGNLEEAADLPARISSVSRIEPAESRMLAQSPILSKAEPIPSPVSSTSICKGEAGGSTVLEPEPSSPVSILPHIRVEPLASTVSPSVGSFSCGGADQQGGFLLPACDSAFQKQEASPNLIAPLPLYSSLANVPLVSNVDAPCEDIRDEMLKLLQQVSLIVSSSTFNTRAS